MPQFYKKNIFSIAISYRRLLRLHLFLLLISPFSAPVFSTENTQNELLSINMHNADIGAVIQWVAEQTNKKIVVDPRVKGKVTVLANQGMSAGQAYQMFLAMLDVYGYAATETEGILRIFPASQAKTSPKKLLQSFDTSTGGEQVMYVYRADNVSATQLVDLLKPLLPSSGYIAAYPESNSLIMADEAANIKRLIVLLKQIDQSGDMTLEVIKLIHADANNVAGLVDSLIPTEKGQPFSIVSDERSNSLLMTGDPATRNRVKQLIRQLDKPINGGGNTRVVYLHYLDAKELVPILQGMGAAIQQDQKDTKSTISIDASESANALIITAPTDIMEAMSDVIAQVDIRQAQVLVEAIIVEVSKDFTKTIGVEWNTSFNSDDSVEAVTNFGLRSINDDGGVSLLGTGLSLGFYRGGSLRALLQAFAKESDTNILSTPSILTLDNHEAEILVGSTVPFITGQVTGSSSSTINPFTTIERHDIGLTLKITPQINEGDSITLEVLQEIETLSESTLVSNDIVTNKRSIKTKVLVEDEAILVLGGLVSDETQQLVSKVPILGDIPLLGRLFKSTTEKIVKKNLMVFIHPVIVDSEQVANQVSNKKYNVMQDLQKKYSSGKFSKEKIELSDFIKYTPNKKTN